MATLGIRDEAHDAEKAVSSTATLPAPWSRTESASWSVGFEAGPFTAAVKKSRHDAEGIRRMGRIVSKQIPAVSLPIPVVHGHLSL